jgi:hypothetical protein
MTTTMRDCLPLARQLHPCHVIMAQHESNEPIVTLNVPSGETFLLPTYIVHFHSGQLKSECFEYSIAGPESVHLVASGFANLYHIVRGGRCLCAKGRVDGTCKHTKRINQSQAVTDDDLIAQEVAV